MIPVITLQGWEQRYIFNRNQSTCALPNRKWADKLVQLKKKEHRKTKHPCLTQTRIWFVSSLQRCATCLDMVRSKFEVQAGHCIAKSTSKHLHSVPNLCQVVVTKVGLKTINIYLHHRQDQAYRLPTCTSNKGLLICCRPGLDLGLVYYLAITLF